MSNDKEECVISDLWTICKNKDHKLYALYRDNKKLPLDKLHEAMFYRIQMLENKVKVFKEREEAEYSSLLSK